jgi:beta-1,4-mannosyltransferase
VNCARNRLVEAFQRVAPPSAVLLIAGSPLNRLALQEIEREIRSPAVRLHGSFVPEEDVQIYMNAADAVVLPYHDVLTSGAVILAMSFGKACIAPRLGCLPDVLDETGAVLYDSGSPNGLANALRVAFERRSQPPAMGAYNLVRARAWRWDEIARATAEVYSDATSRD